MASVVQICNKALGILGQKPILSLDDNSAEAFACNTHWPTILDEVLATHPWDCIVKREKLNRIKQTPAFGFQFYYQLPIGFLRINEIYPLQEYEIEGDRILTNSNEVSIKYNSTTNNTDTFSPELTSALAYLLASELAYQMTNSVSLMERLKSIGDDKLSGARASNAFQGTKRDTMKTSWIKAKEGY